MKRNPYARSLRLHRAVVIADKREKTYRQVLDETAREDNPDWAAELLDKLS
jgi:hypothetical protein